MSTQPRNPVIQVRKYGDLINVAPTTLKSHDEHVAELVSIHGADNVLIDGTTYQDMQVAVDAETQEAPATTPILSVIQPDPMQIGDREVPQVDVINALLAQSGMTVEQWNAAEEHEREAALSAAVESMIEAEGGAK